MRTLKRVVFVSLLLILLLACNSAYAIDIHSEISGAWGEPSTWNPPQVPGPGDDVTITTDTHVTREIFCHLAGPDIVVNSLTVEQSATLSSDMPQDDIGEVLHITAHRITNHGIISANGGYSTGGLVALVLDPWFTLNYDTIPVTVEITELAVLENFGLIEAGDAQGYTYLDGFIGGEVAVLPRLHFIDYDCDGDPNEVLWINPVVLNHLDAEMDGGIARDVGGMIDISAIRLTNDGLIKAGNNDCPPSHVAGYGGCTFMYIQRPRVYTDMAMFSLDIPIPGGVSFLNTGQILGGTDLSSTTSQPPGPGIGGSVWISCEGTWTNSGEILGGDGELGGCVSCFNSMWPWTNTESGQIIAGSSSCTQVQGGNVCAFGNPKVNRGIIRAGDGYPPGNVIDPMLQELSNNAQIWGEDVTLVGGGSITVDLYSLTHQPVIEVEGDLEIILPPGGILEIQGCPGSTYPPYLASAGGEIVIHADSINRNCVPDMNDLFSQPYRVEPGSEFTSVRIGPGGAVIAEPGEESTCWVDVVNMGTEACIVDWQISSEKGWVTSPQQGYESLTPGQIGKIMLSFQIPELVGLSEHDVISLHAEVKEASMTIAEDDNELLIFSRSYSKMASLCEFAATWLSAPAEPAWNVYYNIDGDHIIDFMDFAGFAAWWLDRETVWP